MVCWGNLRTMQPLADALNMREAVVVLPSMFEAQGAFDKDDITRPTGMTAEEIKARFGYG